MAVLTRWQQVARRIRVPMGFVFAVIFLWMARPTRNTIVISTVPVFAGLWLRGYASGYVKKNSELTTTGPYAYTRNPLYLGSMLIAFGFGTAAANWWLLAMLILLFLAIYMPTIRSEEEFLRVHFSTFEHYAARVPRLLPRLSPASANESFGEFSRKLYLHHREYNASIGAGGIYLALLFKFLLSHYPRSILW